MGVIWPGCGYYKKWKKSDRLQVEVYVNSKWKVNLPTYSRTISRRRLLKMRQRAQYKHIDKHESS